MALAIARSPTRRSFIICKLCIYNTGITLVERRKHDTSPTIAVAKDGFSLLTSGLEVIHGQKDCCFRNEHQCYEVDVAESVHIDIIFGKDVPQDAFNDDMPLTAVTTQPISDIYTV